MEPLTLGLRDHEAVVIANVVRRKTSGLAGLCSLTRSSSWADGAPPSPLLLCQAKLGNCEEVIDYSMLDPMR
jgi:hypothetical protein